MTQVCVIKQVISLPRSRAHSRPGHDVSHYLVTFILINKCKEREKMPYRRDLQFSSLSADHQNLRDRYAGDLPVTGHTRAPLTCLRSLARGCGEEGWESVREGRKGRKRKRCEPVS